jgi:hypothetical protein
MRRLARLRPINILPEMLGRIEPGMAAQAPPKQPFQPFSETRRTAPG